MSWTTPVFDRTDADKLYARLLAAKPWAEYTVAEKTDFLAGLKGAYTHIDRNRVEGNTQYLADLLNGYGYYAPVTTKAWTSLDVPTREEMTRYLANIQACIDALAVDLEIPASMVKADIEDANQIERILYELHAMLERMAQTFIPCGEALTGEDNL